MQRGYDLPTGHRCPGPVPLVSSSGVIDSHNQAAVTGPGVVTGRSGSIGNVFYVEEDFWPLNTTLFVSDFRGNDPRFIHYLLRQVDLKSLAGGTGVPTLNRNVVHAQLVDCPDSVEDQRRIVTLLDEAFEGIATSKAHAEQNLRNASELFAQMSAALLASAASSSAVCALEELVTSDCSLSYGIVQPGDELPDGLPIVRPVDLNDGIVTLEGLKRIDPALASSYERTTLRGNDILLCVRGSTGTLAMADNALAGANVTRGIVPIRFDASKLSQEIGYWLMRSEPVQQQIRAKTYGTALMQINIRDLRQLQVPVPPLNAQPGLVQAFADLESHTSELAGIYQRKLTALAELKQSLLHQAFTGQL